MRTNLHLAERNVIRSLSSLCPGQLSTTARRALGVSTLIAVALTMGGCATGGRLALDATPVACEPPGHPVIFVPGILGSRLIDQETGRLLWGSGLNVLLPRDHGYRLALALDGESELEPDGPVEVVKLLFYKRQVYSRVAQQFEAHGYRRGDLDSPGVDDDFFLFSYDWRRDNLHSVTTLAAFLERLRHARGEDRLRVSLVCQSNGAHICRYLLKYGASSLEDSAAGRGKRLDWLDVDSIMLVGTANGGALRTLREIDRGRQYLSPIGRHIKPEAVFTFRSALQDLPVSRTDLFVDLHGQPVDVDLFDPATWQRLGWSIFSPASERRIERRARHDLYEDATARLEYLGRALERTKTLHDLLARDVEDFPPTHYLLVQNQVHDTAIRAIIDESELRPRLIFPTDKAARNLPGPVRELLVARGDGHATLESQQWLSQQELRALGERKVNVSGEHFEAIFEPETMESLVRFHGRSPAASRCGPDFELPSPRTLASASARVDSTTAP